nr:MFS transporter [uncultured Methanospirillum sp.]
MIFKNIHLVMLCFTGYLAMAGGSLLAPVLPEMVTPLQTTAQAVGLLMSVFTLSTAIFTLVLSHFIDRLDRKQILVPSLLIYGLTGIAGYYSTDFTVLLVMRFVQGIGVAGMMTLAFLIIGEAYRGVESISAISRMSMSLAIGAITAPMIGGTLASMGWNYPFLFFVLSIPFALMVTVLLPETREQNRNVRHAGISEALSALREFPVTYTIFMGFSIFFLLYSLIIYLPFMLKELFDFSSGESGLMLAIEGVAVVILASQMRILSCRFSMIRVIAVGFFLVGISMFCISFAASITGIFLLLILFGAGLGLAQTAIDAQIIQITPARSKGGILSIHTCMKYMGMSLAPIILGVILSFTGLQTVFIISGILGIAVTITTLLMRGRFDALVIQGSEPVVSAR